MSNDAYPTQIFIDPDQLSGKIRSGRGVPEVPWFAFELSGTLVSFIT
jgi:hypothetical protein